MITMVEQGRSCRDVITRPSAVSRVLDRAVLRITASRMRDGVPEKDSAAANSPNPQPTSWRNYSPLRGGAKVPERKANGQRLDVRGHTQSHLLQSQMALYDAAARA